MEPTLLHVADTVFYKLKARFSTSNKITTHFIVLVWNRTCNISEGCMPVSSKHLYKFKKKITSPQS